LESVTQGPAFNAGTLSPSEWNQAIINDIMRNGGFDSMNDYLKMHLGYSSIFDVNHSFNTNLCPIPYFHFDLGNGQIIDT
jgi:hypothetical protein